MQSFHLHSVTSPSCVNTQNPNSHGGEKERNLSSLRYSSQRERAFSEALLSLRKCVENEDPKLGSCFHAQMLKLGLERDVFIGNSLLNMYSKCDRIKDAENLFDHMSQRTVVSWTSLMAGYHRNGLADETISLFLRMLECLHPNEFTLAVVLQACALKGDENLLEAIHCWAIKSELILDEFLQNTLIHVYAKLGMSLAAEFFLQRLCNRDVVSWTSIISGSVCHGNSERALELFGSMLDDGVFPNDVAMLTVLKACSEYNNLRTMQCIHGLVLKGNWCISGLALNSLIEMYSAKGYFTDSLKIFCQFCFGNEALYPNPETMANILQGCGNSGSLKIGEQIHGYLIKHGFLPCTIPENSLINMYAKNGCKDSALLLFRKMTKRDIISWNTIISCFVKNDQPIEALRFLGEIQRQNSRDDVSPDFVTLLTALEACSDMALLPHGQIIHGYSTKAGFLADVFIQNALIDMYAKSGRLDFAENIFKEMHERDISSWNSIIASYGLNGNGNSALWVFNHLSESGSEKPNAVTFVNILSACAHAGFVEKGLEIFNSMETLYGEKPRTEHFACMVDLLGRAGRLVEAEAFIRNMPIQAGRDVWGALLSACVVSGDLRIAEKAAKELAVLEPSSSIWRVALSNAYAAAGKWEKVAEMRGELRQFRKEGGWSSVNVGGREFSFMAGDTNGPESVVIYEVISRLINHMRDDTSIVLLA